MQTITTTLEREWFSKIVDGSKRIEYRDIKPYWTCLHTSADAIAFGRLFIANQDLVDRVRLGAGLNAPDRSTFYGGGAHGFTDYPTLISDARIADRV